MELGANTPDIFKDFLSHFEPAETLSDEVEKYTTVQIMASFENFYLASYMSAEDVYLNLKELGFKHATDQKSLETFWLLKRK